MKIEQCLVIKLLFFSLVLLVLSGCSNIIGPNETDIESNTCNYEKIDKKIKDDNDTILWAIKGGSKARDCLNYQKSNEFFDKAETSYKQSVDKDSTMKNILESSVSILVNNNVNEYEGDIYEKVMLNTYKALNFASLNDPQNARVEFNRALDRQRRAKDIYRRARNSNLRLFSNGSRNKNFLPSSNSRTKQRSRYQKITLGNVL